MNESYVRPLNTINRELREEVIRLEGVCEKLTSERDGFQEAVVEAAAEIVRLKQANESLFQKFSALFNECSVEGMQEITDDEADEDCVGAPTVSGWLAARAAIATAGTETSNGEKA